MYGQRPRRRIWCRTGAGRYRLLRVKEVAQYRGVCHATVCRLMEACELPHLRIVNSIRIRPDDLRALVERQTGRGD